MAQTLMVSPLEMLFPVKASPAPARGTSSSERGASAAAPAESRAAVKDAAGTPGEGRSFSAVLQEASASGSPPAQGQIPGPAGDKAGNASDREEGQIAPELQPEPIWPSWLLSLLAVDGSFPSLGKADTETMGAGGTEASEAATVTEGPPGGGSVLLRLLAFFSQDLSAEQKVTPEELPRILAQLASFLSGAEVREFAGAGNPAVEVEAGAKVKADGFLGMGEQVPTSSEAVAGREADKRAALLLQALRQAVRGGTAQDLAPIDQLATFEKEQAEQNSLLLAPYQEKVDPSVLLEVLKKTAGAKQVHYFHEHRGGSREGSGGFLWTAVWLQARQPEIETAAKADLQLSQLPGYYRLAGEEPLAEKVLTQLIHRASVFVREGSSEMRLQLIPESLGRVTMRIAVEHGNVTARFTVANEQVKNLIEAQLPQLRQALEEQGLHMDSFSVSCQLGGEERPWPGQEQVTPRDWTPGGEGDRAEKAYESSERSAALVHRGTGIWGAEGVIDALV